MMHNRMSSSCRILGSLPFTIESIQQVTFTALSDLSLLVLKMPSLPL